MNDIAIDTDQFGAATAAQRSKRTKMVAATVIGNGIEMFDFTVYSFFAVLIGKLFFPTDTPLGSLLLSVATFGLGFTTRPLGAIILGSYADRHGRKAAMLATMALMMVGSLLIACAPTYAQIGIFAPILIIVGRLLQGFSAGGEIGAATTLLMESSTANRRGFQVSWQMASQGAAALAGALIATWLSSSLSPADLEQWGWRVPFLIGLLIMPVGLYLRRHLDETHKTAKVESSPVRELFAGYGEKLLLGVLIIAGGTVSMYVVVYYMPTYMIRILHMPPTTSFFSSCLSGLTLLVVAPLGGLLADRLRSRKTLCMFTSVLSLLLIYPAFWLLNYSADLVVSLSLIVGMTACMALGSAASFLLLLEAFPVNVRATGVSIIYATGVTLFGGTAQLAVTWLIAKTGDPFMATWYMVGFGVISLIALVLYPEQASDRTGRAT